MSSFEELMAREYFIKEEGWTTPAGISELSGNCSSAEEAKLNELVKVGRVSKIILHFPKEPSDGFGDNKITYFLRSDLSNKIQNEERKPETIRTQETGRQETSRPQYADRNYFHPIISTVRWKLRVEGKESFGSPGAIRY